MAAVRENPPYSLPRIGKILGKTVPANQLREDHPVVRLDSLIADLFPKHIPPSTSAELSNVVGPSSGALRNSSDLTVWGNDAKRSLGTSTMSLSLEGKVETWDAPFKQSEEEKEAWLRQFHERIATVVAPCNPLSTDNPCFTEVVFQTFNQRLMLCLVGLVSKVAMGTFGIPMLNPENIQASHYLLARREKDRQIVLTAHLSSVTEQFQNSDGLATTRDPVLVTGILTVELPNCILDYRIDLSPAPAPPKPPPSGSTVLLGDFPPEGCELPATTTGSDSEEED